MIGHRSRGSTDASISCVAAHCCAIVESPTSQSERPRSSASAWRTSLLLRRACRSSAGCWSEHAALSVP
eukprot:2911739-Prymnesium_polylepis.1